MPSNEELNQFVEVLEKSTSNGLTNDSHKEVTRQDSSRQMQHSPISQMFMSHPSPQMPEINSPASSTAEAFRSNMSGSPSQNSGKNAHLQVSVSSFITVLIVRHLLLCSSLLCLEKIL